MKAILIFLTPIPSKYQILKFKAKLRKSLENPICFTTKLQSYSQQATEKLANNFKKTAARVNKSSFLTSIIYLARNITTNGKRIRLRFISAISAVEGLLLHNGKRMVLHLVL